MKKILLLLVVATGLVACSGEDGIDGVNIVGQAFDTTVTFTAPDYRVRVPYPNSIEVFPGDVTLAYIRFADATGNNGNQVGVYRLLPQVLYTDFGEFQYNYDFTDGDIDLFLDAPDLNTLDNLTTADVNNQRFRIVILPANVINGSNLDVTNYEAVMDAANLNNGRVLNFENQ